MKTTAIIIMLIGTMLAQNTYEIQPGVKNNQIVLELSNTSPTETVQITSLLNLSKGEVKERIKFTGETEKLVELQSGETKEIKFTFDVAYRVGKTEADTIEFMITDKKSIYLTKQFILQYSVPTEYKLDQNYPNPFNPTTKIRYSIPRSTEYYSVLHNVTLKVYDILGNEVATLVNEPKDPGYYEVEFSTGSFGNASEFASGVYFYRLQAGSFISTKKMILVK